MRKTFFSAFMMLSIWVAVAAGNPVKKVTVTRDIAYRDGNSKSWVLDIADPVDNKDEGARPAIVIVHGGGWSAGSKTDAVYTNLLLDYAMQGYVALSVEYRFNQEAAFPACIEDVKCAVRWLKAHAKEWNVDPNRIGVFGHSAGGHLSLMLGVSSENKELEGDGPWKEYSSSVACAIGGAPPTEIGNPNSPWSQHPEWWPIGYISDKTSPLLLLQGSEDPIVKPNLTDDYVKKMHACGAKQVEYIKIHGQHNVSYDYGLEITKPAMDAFFAKHLKLKNSDIKIEQMKVIDAGGSGPYKAIAVTEKSLPDYVIYRPVNMEYACAKEGKLPILLFANGGCMDTSVGYERMLTEMASRGYVVVAIGAMQVYQNDRKENSTPSSMLIDALHWIVQQSTEKGSDYFDRVDIQRIAAGGHSCGGAQVLCNAAEKQISTYLIFNAGMGKMTMAGASSKSLKGLHGPILYLIGGEKDVAYQNAIIDYDAIKKVPVVFADNAKAGHGGSYGELNGGTFAKLAIRWLDWQLKGKDEYASIFKDAALKDFPEWTIKSKNFK